MKSYFCLTEMNPHVDPVNVRNIQNCREFLWVYLSQTDNCQEAKSRWIEKTLQRMAILQPILHIRIRGGNWRGCYMKSIGYRCRGGRRKQSRKTSGIGKKVKCTDTHFFYMGGYSLVNDGCGQPIEMVRGVQGNDEGFWGPLLRRGGCRGGVRRPDKGDYSDIPRACYLRCKKTMDRLT